MYASLILGLVAAAGWGTADFLARFAARRVGAYRTLFFMQGFGVVGLIVCITASGGFSHFFDGRIGEAWLWAGIAGLLNVVSGLALYHAFEVGVLAIVAPISACYPALTVLLAVATGEALTGMRAAGIVAVLLGVALAATSFAGITPPESHAVDRSGKRPLARGVGWAVVAAVGFGAVFWLLGFRVLPKLGGVASVSIIRFTTFVTLALIAAPMKQSLRLPLGSIWWLVAAVGVIDTSAFVVNNVALKIGQVSLVTVIASLYSTVTVLLAWIFLRERLTWTQWLGISLIFTGIVLVSR